MNNKYDNGSARLLSSPSSSAPENSFVACDWLEKFFNRCLPMVDGQDMLSSVLSCGAVIVTAAAMETIDPDTLGQLTGFPETFGRAVCATMTQHEL